MLITALLTLLTAPQPQAPIPSNAPLADAIERRVDALVRRMSLEQKIDYIGGYHDFYTHPMPGLNLPEIKMSDGPAGIRNYGPDTAYAAPVTLAASWDPALAERVGRSFGLDGRRRGVHIVLSPGVNIARLPMNGRNFEYLGEDPYLAAQMVAPYIQGVQSEGVMATVKHYAANSQEHGRWDYSMDVDERTLREIYFPAFESAVKKGGVWSVMCAYNLLNGTYCSANRWLLTDVLKKDWGFKGFVMSDWGAVHDSVPVANAGLDLEMPGPDFMNRKNLMPAIKSGILSEATITDKVRRMLRSFISMGFLDRDQTRRELPADSPLGDKVVHDTSLEGMVLLKNARRVLPLSSNIKRIAVIGPNADPAITGGGGSSYTQPFHAVSVLEAIKARAGGRCEVVYAAGTDKASPRLFATSVFTAPDGTSGLRGEYFANRNLEGPAVGMRNDAHLNFNWTGSPMSGIGHNEFSVRWTGSIHADADGDYDFVASGDDGYRVFIDGKSVMDMWQEQGVTETLRTVHLTTGTHTIRVEYFQAAGESVMRFGWRKRSRHAIDEAVVAAESADVAIVAVGFNPRLEGEGEDRTFALPGGQDELIRRVARANPRTIVVLNAGHAVDATSWVDSIAGFVHAWYPGQSGNRALAEILFGDVSPSGKLPISFDRRWEDSAAYGNYPGDPKVKRVKYPEGLFVGYRHYDASSKKPLFPFGYGLSYTRFAYDSMRATRMRTPEAQVRVTFSVRNIGKRSGAEVAQVYVQPIHAPVTRPLKELKGFARVNLAPGASHQVSLTLDPRAFAYWDTARHDWKVAHGEYRILVGGSSQDLPLKATVRL